MGLVVGVRGKILQHVPMAEEGTIPLRIRLLRVLKGENQILVFPEHLNSNSRGFWGPMALATWVEQVPILSPKTESNSHRQQKGFGKT